MTNGPESRESGLPVYAVRYTERAVRDMDSAMVFLDEAVGGSAAIDWCDGLHVAVGTLATLPARWPVNPDGWPRLPCAS